MSFRASAILGAGIALMTLGVIFQFLPRSQSSRVEHSSVGLADRVPKLLAGWSVRDEPLGGTERAQGAVKAILNYDEYVYRIYTQGVREVGVYIAYWGPGRMPVRLVQLHTPDRCWTENGWNCQGAKFGRAPDFGDVKLLPGQWRVFTPPGGANRTYVYFWLLDAGKNYDFGERLNIIPNPFRWWTQFVKEIFIGYKEKYFIRLTSNRPFEELNEDAGFQELVAALEKLGLASRR